MIDEQALQQQAHDDGLDHAQRIFEGAFIVELGEPQQRWDPVRLRQVFDQPMKLWRHMSDFEVVLDRENRPVGFIDHDKWTDCRWEALTDAEIVDLVAVVGAFEGDLAVVHTVRGEEDVLEADLQETRPYGKVYWYRVRINPARQAVISLMPMTRDLL